MNSASDAKQRPEIENELRVLSARLNEVPVVEPRPEGRQE